MKLSPIDCRHARKPVVLLQVLEREIDLNGMSNCFYSFINEHSAWTQVVKSYSSHHQHLTDNFEECEERFLAEVLSEFQRGSKRFKELLGDLGKPKEMKSGSKTRFAWMDVDGTDHRIIKSYIRNATCANAARFLGIRPYLTSGEGYLNTERGVACVVTNQDLLATWEKV
jgi:hypothetical protein